MSYYQGVSKALATGSKTTMSKIINVWDITNTISLADLGGYQADDEAGALDAMAIDAGYRDYADLRSQVPSAPGEIRVTLQSVVVD